MNNDKRFDQRFLIQRGVRIKLPSGTIVCGVTRDLSFSGSFIECDTRGLCSGDECYLTVFLENDEESAPIFTDIRFLDKDGIGCHFLTFDNGYYQFLAKYSLQIADT